MSSSLLCIRDLAITFDSHNTTRRALNGVDLTLAPGEILGVVGESGSGKTTTALAAIGLLAPEARITSGQILLDDEDIVSASKSRLRSLRGPVVSMIFQNPRSALNPVRRIGLQIVDAIRAHRKVSAGDAWRQAVDLLVSVQLKQPERLMNAYPHQLSGGMCQRVMIAIALSSAPRLLLADEPTTGLDATTQRTVMDLLAGIIRQRGMSMMLITHDLALAAEYSDRIVVMRNGQVIETAQAQTLFDTPRQSYTRDLIAATPLPSGRVDDLLGPESRPARRMPATARDTTPPLLDVSNLCKAYGGENVVEDLSLVIHRGQSVGLVGESGAGKSTVARLVSRLIDPTSGRISFDGQDIGSVPARAFHASTLRQSIQLVFQDPVDSLNPRFTAFDCIAAPLRTLVKVGRRDLRAKVRELATQVDLSLDLLDRLPHQLSGGEKARVGIARALAAGPRLLVLDEPTASLDVQIQATVLALLERLKRQNGLTFLFISHDLNVIRMMCDQTIVMRAGRVIEQGPTRSLFEQPKDTYTKALLDAMPKRPAKKTMPA